VEAKPYLLKWKLLFWNDVFQVDGWLSFFYGGDSAPSCKNVVGGKCPTAPLVLSPVFGDIATYVLFSGVLQHSLSSCQVC